MVVAAWFLARRVSTKEGEEDSMKACEEEKSIKLSIKKEGMGMDGGGRGRCWEEDAIWSTSLFKLDSTSLHQEKAT